MYWNNENKRWYKLFFLALIPFLNSFLPPFFRLWDDKATQGTQMAEIHSVNLDLHFLSDPDLIDLMKVDVEGAELIVLEGAKELFKQVCFTYFLLV
jgi:FkbM family methyltransferase